MKVWFCDSKRGDRELESLLDLKAIYELENKGVWLYNNSFLNKIYYYIDHRNDCVYFAQSIRDLTSQIKLEIDDEISFFYKNTGFVVPPYTIYTGIKRITVASKFCLTGSEIITNNIYPKSGNGDLEIEKFEDILKAGIPNDIDKSVLTLSGGADSSLLAALCGAEKIQPDTITCIMNGFESEADRARLIAEKCNLTNMTYVPDKLMIDKIGHAYTYETLEPVYDSIMPVITHMIDANKYQVLLDGQGADSLLMGLPHNRLVEIYHPYFNILRPLALILERIPISKGNKVSRLLYRMSKVVKSITCKDVYSCLLTSLNFPCVTGNSYYRFVYEELNAIYSQYQDVHKMVAYFFLYKIVAIREMQKYEILRKQGMRVELPFLNEDLIEYCFELNSAELFDKNMIKKPVYYLLEKYLPNIIPINRTSPFYVKTTHVYSDNLTNAFEGVLYPIQDLDCYTNATKWLTVLTNHIHAELEEKDDGQVG